MTENDEMKKRKNLGLALIIVPIELWVLVALLNGFNFSRPWLGATTNAFLGIVAVILIVVGFVLYLGKKKE